MQGYADRLGEPLSTEVAVAYVSGAFSILATVIAVYSAARVNRKSDALNARRSYEYDARKRLYLEVEPLLFSTSMATKDALEKIFNLADAAREGTLGQSSQSWLSRRGYYFNSRIYGLLRPAALCEIIDQRLTAVDLSLDRRIAIIVGLLHEYKAAFATDFKLSRISPNLNYAPSSHTELPTTGAADRREGLVTGRLENCINALIVRDAEFRSRIISFGEFEDAIQSNSSVRDRIEPLAAILDGFAPVTSPVLWRILTLKAVLLKLILAILSEPHGKPNAQRLLKRLKKDRAFRQALRVPVHSLEAEPLDCIYQFTAAAIQRLMDVNR